MAHSASRILAGRLTTKLASYRPTDELAKLSIGYFVRESVIAPTARGPYRQMSGIVVIEESLVAMSKAVG